ncbi:RrF2 family transcriptional regulator [Eubacterium oxidoreducens]|uniref:Transcriptional regulator, BadM/Rrf2 family n=1 Tax=Eubacterium oxidoreducens TaxID=1732 RepID=A0A1G6CHB0_EUBOX|nr:Rrf2 family transcriptional regulator [Eubacterium oxidoreducens]SDB32249.1 transcriptional regulator, BadM/Rrf2 family [Eubacterium oxidoreducens]
MKISTKGRYAIRVMLDLAMHKEDGYVSLKDIAKRQDLSNKYLEMIISILNKAGYVQSTRGKFGGYKLSYEPEKYTMAAILKTTEGSMAPVSCLDCPGECAKEAECITLPMWKKLDQIIEEYLESVTLQDLLDTRADTYTI